MCQWRSEWPLCALQKITMMTVSCITQLCSKTKSLSGLLHPGRRLLLFRAPTIISNCLSWFYIEPCDDFKNESLFTTSASTNSYSQQTGSLDFKKQQLRLPKKLFLFCLSFCLCTGRKSCQQSSRRDKQRHLDMSLHRSRWNVDKQGRLLGRFCLSQHGITPLVWSHFAWLHPGWLPMGAQRGRQLDRRSLLLVGWQDVGSVSHWVDPLSSCYLLSPWPRLS